MQNFLAKQNYEVIDIRQLSVNITNVQLFEISIFRIKLVSIESVKFK